MKALKNYYTSMGKGYILSNGNIIKRLKYKQQVNKWSPFNQLIKNWLNQLIKLIKNN